MQNIYYPTQLLRAFKQAPWRQQMQMLAGLSITLLIVLVIGGLYLAVASRAGNAGRDLQRLEIRKAELLRQNDRLRAELADLREMNRMALRALALGFAPATPEQVRYVAVNNYPTQTLALVDTPEITKVAAQPTTLEWLTSTLRELLGGG